MAINLPLWFLLPVLIILIWEIIWKGIALWKSAKANQMPWFIIILIFNTAGILPIIYLGFFQKRKTHKNKRG